MESIWQSELETVESNQSSSQKDQTQDCTDNRAPDWLTGLRSEWSRMPDCQIPARVNRDQHESQGGRLGKLDGGKRGQSQKKS